MISSRERVRIAIARGSVDRVPHHFRAEPEVYRAIRESRGLADDEAVRRWAHSDVRDLGLILAEGGYGGYTGFGWRDRELPGGVQEDFWGVRRRRVEFAGGSYIEICDSPLQRASPRDVRAYEWPDPARLFDFSALPARADALDPGHACWHLLEVESLFDRCWALRGMEQFLADLLESPEVADLMIRGMAGFFETRTRMLLDASRGCLDGVGLYNDLGTQNGLMISPALYRRFVKPWQRRLVEMVKGYDVTVFYHACGAVEPLLEDFIDIGVDIVDPVQMRAMGTTPEHLKATYGSRLVFHGGLDTQALMNRVRPDDAAREAHRLIEKLGRGGGYILSGSHFYQPDVPLENIEAVNRVVGG